MNFISLYQTQEKLQHCHFKPAGLWLLQILGQDYPFVISFSVKSGSLYNVKSGSNEEISKNRLCQL